jgi:hypothetical protein
MKFLCVPCDRPMKLEQTTSDGGSVSLVYSCPDCGYECALLTNPMETQVVASLGVKFGPDGSATSGESKCPFTAMVQDASADQPGKPADFRWTSAAENRMQGVPDFVRPMVRTGIERFARERGYPEVDERVLDEAKDSFGL